MKTSFLIQGIVAICIALMSQVCNDDKFYDLGGFDARKVAFSAINLDLDSIYRAESTIKYYTDLYRVDKFFPLTVYYSYDETTEHYTADVHTARESVIWDGVDNAIRITFTPSSSEEKEASFTMPDGSIFTVTANRPTFIWTPDSSLRGKSHYVGNIYFEARSIYTNNTEFINKC